MDVWRECIVCEISESLHKKIFDKWRWQEIQEIQTNVCVHGIKDAKTVPNASPEDDDKVWDGIEDNWEFFGVKKRIKVGRKNWKSPGVSEEFKEHQRSRDSDFDWIGKERKVNSELLERIHFRYSVLMTFTQTNKEWFVSMIL